MSVSHDFANPELLRRALTHSSWGNENEGRDNERLEFLGDAVLELCVTQMLFERFPDTPEGHLTPIRARLVNTTSLANVARKHGLGSELRLGNGEELSGGRDKDSILEAAVEAVLGAVYLDGGLPAAQAVVHGWLSERVERIAKLGAEGWKDAKSLLQERTQAATQTAPSYRVVGQEGPAHKPRFRVEVMLDGVVLAQGTGRKIKDAEQEAAAVALEGYGEPS